MTQVTETQALEALENMDSDIPTAHAAHETLRSFISSSTQREEALRGDLDSAKQSLEMLTADFNDCNQERARWSTRAQIAEADVTALREALAGMIRLYDDVDEGDKTIPEFVAACSALLASQAKPSEPAPPVESATSEQNPPSHTIRGEG